eukprot:10247307-Lingulodinium_polyedra.AAC.1
MGQGLTRTIRPPVGVLDPPATLTNAARSATGEGTPAGTGRARTAGWRAQQGMHSGRQWEPSP